MSCRWVLPARSILGRTGTSSSGRACGYFSMGGYPRAAPPGASASAMGGGPQLRCRKFRTDLRVRPRSATTRASTRVQFRIPNAICAIGRDEQGQTVGTGTPRTRRAALISTGETVAYFFLLLSGQSAGHCAQPAACIGMPGDPYPVCPTQVPPLRPARARAAAGHPEACRERRLIGTMLHDQHDRATAQLLRYIHRQRI
jgi:hypothetical protein